MRDTPLTTQTIHAISDHGRALNMHFMADGHIDANEHALLTSNRWAANRSAWSDYGRRKSQHVENYARLSPRMLREARELEAEFGPDVA